MKWCETAAEEEADKAMMCCHEGDKLRSAAMVLVVNMLPACMRWVSNLRALNPHRLPLVCSMSSQMTS